MEHSSSFGQNYRFFDSVGAARRNKKRKTEETEFASNIENALRESEHYKRLREYERRLDAVIQGRNVEVAEIVSRVDRTTSTLRIYIWNEFTTTPSGLTKNLPFWKLKIAGRLLRTKLKPGEVTQDLTESNFHTSMPFGYFLKGIEIEVEEEEGIDQRPPKIQWTKSHGPDDDEKEVFEILRPGDKEKKMKISLTMDHQAPLFRLNTQLSQILGIEIGSRSKIITELWNYIKLKNLQSSKDPGVINCDPSLKMVFGDVTSMPLVKISAKLDDLLTPADVVMLDYQLQPTGSTPVVYDVELELPIDTRQQSVPQFPRKQMQDAEVGKLNQIIKETALKISELKRKRHFYMGFSQNPAEFINTLLIAQSKEVRMIKRFGGRDSYRVETQTEFFKEKWVEDAVVKYFQRKLASGH